MYVEAFSITNTLISLETRSLNRRFYSPIPNHKADELRMDADRVLMGCSLSKLG